MDEITKRLNIIGQYVDDPECENNLIAADIPINVTILGETMTIESVWRNDDGDIYIHVGCPQFEGDLKVSSLSDDNIKKISYTLEPEVEYSNKLREHMSILGKFATLCANIKKINVGEAFLVIWGTTAKVYHKNLKQLDYDMVKFYNCLCEQDKRLFIEWLDNYYVQR